MAGGERTAIGLWFRTIIARSKEHNLLKISGLTMPKSYRPRLFAGPKIACVVSHVHLCLLLTKAPHRAQ